MKYRPRLEVLRNGAFFKELTIPQDEAPQISFDADAAIKTSFSCVAVYDSDVNWLTDEVRCVAETDGAREEYGVFIITTPTENKDGTQRTAEITGYDRTYLAKLSKLETRQYFAKGTLYSNAITQLLVASGISDFIIEPSAAVLQTDREDWDTGTDRLTIINTLLAEMCYESLYADAKGIVTAKAKSEVSAENVKFTYTKDTKSILFSEFKAADDTFNVPNVFIVAVDNVDMDEPMRATAINDDVTSSVSVASRNARIVEVVQLDNIASAKHLQQYADNLMLQSKLDAEQRVFYTANEAGHGLHDVVAINCDEISGVFIETAWRCDLSMGGKMQHNVRRALWLY
ncbi:MAG: hypothetical protein GXZ14_00810 [Ruminococcaceae bacterium]|nr:hypothetical protein [Oscillospiraceae bacterium]